MIVTEKLANSIGEKITLEMNYDENKKAIIIYGLTAIIQMASILTIISLVGIVFDFWFESIIIFFGVGVIRKSTGGAHSKTMFGCMVISVLSITILSALSRYFFNFYFSTYVNCGISIFVFVFCFIVIYQRVPVDSPNKPIIKEEKIKRLRKQSFFIVTLFFLLSIVFIVLSSWNNRFYSIALSIRLAMIWQIFTITKIGAKIICMIDSKLNK